MLVRKAGFEPVGRVGGSSIYHIGDQRGSFNQNMELNVLSQAMYHARELAISRMEAEADILGADGIVGVRLDVGRYEWGESLAEFIAIGTAVRSRDGVSQTHQQEQAIHPRSVGAGFLRAAHDGLPSGRTGDGLLRLSRRASGGPAGMERMQHEAIRLGAEGVVGVSVKEQSHD